MSKSPFNEGEIVRIKGEDHLWFDGTKPGVTPYWLCECTEIREPIDWSKIPEGATGIVTGSYWRGSSEHLEAAR